MRTAAVIPTWNGRQHLESLFPDLKAQTAPFAEILVVDNGSADGSAEWAEAQGARVLRLPKNLGFAAAVNAGVGAADAEHVAILNNDIRLAADWLARISRDIGTHAFATGKVLSMGEPAKLDATFDAVCLGGTAWRCGSGRLDAPLWNRTGPVMFPPLTAALVRRDVFLAVGGLDEEYESYLEDVDFGLRCASKGYIGTYVPGAVSWHAGSATLGIWSARGTRLQARNQLRFVARHYPRPLPVRYGYRIAVAQLLWGALALRNGRGLAWAAGKLEGLRRYGRWRTGSMPGVEDLLRDSEAVIYELQSATGMDLYWRLYFLLTGRTFR